MRGLVAIANDQRIQRGHEGLALGVGIGSIGALLVLPACALLGRRSPKEAYAAFAIAQKTPPVLVYGILIGVAAASMAALVSLTRALPT